MVQVFQHTGYTAAARAFSGTFRFGRVGPTSGPWLSVDPGFGVPGMQSQASFDDRALPVHREPEGWAIPIRGGYRFSERHDIEVSVRPPVQPWGGGEDRHSDALPWGRPRWSVAVNARVSI